jgi:inner membrane protein
MDNLTHTLTGLALADSGLKRTTRLGTVTLLVAANLPDVDGLSYVFGSGTDGLAFRRGWTHGILAMLLWPPFLVGVVLLASTLTRRKLDGVRWRWLLLLAAIGVCSHPLLDLLNTYGVRLLMPFSSHWFYGDALFIVDPWIWIVLIIGIVWSRRARRDFPARTALACSVAYALAMALGTKRAEAATERESAGVPARRTLASPVPGNPFERRVIRDLGDRYATGEARLTTRWRFVADGELVTGCNTPAAESAARTTRGAVFLGWARFPYCVAEPENNVLRVTISDLRYGGRGGSWASVTVRVPVPQ